MRLMKRSLLSASLMLGAAMASTGLSAAFAQGADNTEAEEPAEIFEEAEACADGDDCAQVPVEAEEVFADDAWMSAPAAEATATVEAEAVAEAAPAAAAPVAEEQAQAQGGAVLAAPGSTDESNPGGSTRPGTRPDD